MHNNWFDPAKKNLQYLQLGQSLERLLVGAHDLVVVQLEAAQRSGSLERFPSDCGEGIIRKVAVDVEWYKETIN